MVVVPMQIYSLKTQTYCIVGHFTYALKLEPSVFTLK